MLLVYLVARQKFGSCYFFFRQLWLEDQGYLLALVYQCVNLPALLNQTGGLSCLALGFSSVRPFLCLEGKDPGLRCSASILFHFMITMKIRFSQVNIGVGDCCCK